MLKLVPFQKEDNISEITYNWGLKAINVQKLWDRNIKGDGRIVAVIDTGVDREHESLESNIIDGANFTKNYEGSFYKYGDNNGHGTHVSGIIAANNYHKNVGMAPKAKILALKALEENGSGRLISIIRALYYAISWRSSNNEKVSVICLSLGTSENSPLLKDAIQYAISNNISVVAASGNNGDGTEDREYTYPGYYNKIIQVGAIDEKFDVADFSNNNYQIDLVAPGTNIYSTFKENQYQLLSGTSMAAPFVAASLVLLSQYYHKLFKRELTTEELYAQLIRHTDFYEDNVPMIGNGIINFDK